MKVVAIQRTALARAREEYLHAKLVRELYFRVRCDSASESSRFHYHEEFPIRFQLCKGNRQSIQRRVDRVNDDTVNIP